MRQAFRPQFWIDVEDGVAYVTRRSSAATARRWHSAVMETVQLLTRQPGFGHPRRDSKPTGLRSFRVRRFPRYLVFYIPGEDTVEFLRVKHGMMNLPALFQPPEEDAH